MWQLLPAAYFSLVFVFATIAYTGCHNHMCYCSCCNTKIDEWNACRYCMRYYSCLPVVCHDWCFNCLEAACAVSIVLHQNCTTVSPYGCQQLQLTCCSCLRTFAPVCASFVAAMNASALLLLCMWTLMKLLCAFVCPVLCADTVTFVYACIYIDVVAT